MGWALSEQDVPVVAYPDMTDAYAALQGIELLATQYLVDQAGAPQVGKAAYRRRLCAASWPYAALLAGLA